MISLSSHQLLTKDTWKKKSRINYEFITVMGILQVICATWWLCLSCLLAAYLPVSQPLREGHWLVQPLSGCTMSQLHRSMFRRDAAHRKLPATEDHRQGKLCQGQTGAAHTDWSRGRFDENVDTRKRGPTQNTLKEQSKHGALRSRSGAGLALWPPPQLGSAGCLHHLPLAFLSSWNGCTSHLRKQHFCVCMTINTLLFVLASAQHR